MTDMDFAALTLFITGPTWLRQEVKEAALLPEFGHRDLENEKRFGPAMAHLRTLAGLGADDRDWDVIICNGSGSTAMEISIRSLVAENETVLNVAVGAFGDLYHTLAQVNGKKAVQLRFDSGESVDLAIMEHALQQHAPAVVTLTHNETSTGVRNPLQEMCTLVRQYGGLPLVDGVSIFGGAPIDLPGSGAAMYATATQKALGLPAGFGIAFVHKDAEEKAQTVANRGHATDIVRLLSSARKHQTLTTPNAALANQLAVQLDYIVNREGVDNRFERHETMRAMTEKWANEQELTLFAPAGRRSPTLTAVTAPQSFTLARLKELKERMRGHGYLFDPGYSKLNKQQEEHGKALNFRIGHMGDATPDMLAAYLEVLARELRGMSQ